MKLNIEALVELGRHEMAQAGVVLLARVAEPVPSMRPQRAAWILGLDGLPIPCTPQFPAEEDACIYWAIHGEKIVDAIRRADQ